MPMNTLSTPAAAAPSPHGLNDYLPTGGDTPDSPEEAARAFEKVLARRFVKTMTKDMFDSPLSGKDGPGWMKSQRGRQRDILTDVLTDHIVDSETLGIADMLLRDWGLAPEQDDAQPPASEPVPAGPADTAPSLEALPSGRPLHIAAQIE